MTDKTQPRCPNCGKFQENEPDGFYGKLDPSDDIAPVEVFCSSGCYSLYQEKREVGAAGPTHKETMT